MATASQLGSSGADSIPKTVILAFYAIAATLGLAPFAYFLQSLEFPGIALLVILAGAVVVGRNAKYQSGPTPAWGELALAMLGASGLGALCGIFGFFLYVLFNYSYEAFAWLSGANPSAFAVYLSGALTIFFAVAVGANQVPEFLTRLSPSSKDQPSIYQKLPKDRQRLLLLWSGALAGVAALAVIVLLDLYPPEGQWQSWFGWISSSKTALLVVVNVYWMMITQVLWDPGETDQKAAASLQLAEKFGSLLEAAGYQVRIYPKTGDAEADALVSLLDFLAIKEDKAMAGRIRLVLDDTSLRHELASLQPAVWALEDKLVKQHDAIEIEAVAVLVGDPALVSVAAGFSLKSQSAVRIINPASERLLDDVIAETDPEKKRSLAKQLIEEAMPPGVPVA